MLTFYLENLQTYFFLIFFGVRVMNRPSALFRPPQYTGHDLFLSLSPSDHVHSLGHTHIALP